MPRSAGCGVWVVLSVLGSPLSRLGCPPMPRNPITRETTMAKYRAAKKGGYECSSKGDRRFSAFHARLFDGRTIEEHYQCDVKGYDPGGTNWRLGKGKPPLDTERDLWSAYLILWTVWAIQHPELIQELKEKADEHGGVLSDCFAQTPVNQAAALAQILNML